MSTSEARLSSSTLPLQGDSTPGGFTYLVQELEQRRKELAVVNAIAGVVARSPDIADLLEQALARLLEVMELEAGAVFLLNGGGDELARAASLGFSEEYQRTVTHLKVGQHLTGRVAKTQTPVFIEDIGKHRRLSGMVMRREGVRSFAGIPLRSKDRLLGVMNVIGRESRRFEPSDRNLLLSVGDQLAVAIDNAQLFDTSSRVAILEERNWLAREIHDTLAQGLVALTLQLELALTQLAEQRDALGAETSLRRSLELARENLEEARRSVSNLRGGRVPDLGLASAIEQLAKEFSTDTGIKVYKSVTRRLGLLPVNLGEGLYRIAQEALNNVWKHAHAQSVWVALHLRNDQVRLTIRDDGLGFNPLARRPDGHFGIIGMGERASLLGGRLDLQSKPGHGTLVRAVVPVQPSGWKDGRRD